MPFVEEPRQKKLAGKEQHRGDSDIEGAKGEQQTRCKQRKQGLRDLIEADGLAAWR